MRYIVLLLLLTGCMRVVLRPTTTVVVYIPYAVGTNNESRIITVSNAITGAVWDLWRNSSSYDAGPLRPDEVIR